MTTNISRAVSLDNLERYSDSFLDQLYAKGYAPESRSPDISVSEIDRFFSQRSSATACLRRRQVPGKKVTLQSSCRHTAATTRVR